VAASHFWGGNLTFSYIISDCQWYASGNQPLGKLYNLAVAGGTNLPCHGSWTLEAFFTCSGLNLTTKTGHNWQQAAWPFPF